MPCMVALPDGTYIIMNGAQQGFAGFGLATAPNHNAVRVLVLFLRFSWSLMFITMVGPIRPHEGHWRSYDRASKHHYRPSLSL